MVIYTEFQYISVPGMILVSNQKLLHISPSKRLQIHVYYTMVIYTEFLYISVPGIILGIKPKTIAYMTQLTSLNTRVLRHGYKYRISVYFSSRYNSEFRTRNDSTYMTQLTSLNTCVLHHG